MTHLHRQVKGMVRLKGTEESFLATHMVVGWL